MKVEFSVDDRERLAHLFTEFKLSYLASESSIVFERAGKTSALPILLELAEGEKEVRFARRTQRLLKAACLPLGKTLETLDETKLHPRTVTTLRELASGVFLENGDNALFYGPPGRGKTHAAIAIADAIARTGRSVYFTPTFRIVQELLAARRDLSLPKALRKLDSFELLVLDDIGYVQQSADEVEVLFTLLAERYERRSVLVTSNLAFSQWDRIFKNEMTTAAAIDRFVHHCTIVDFSGKSVRAAKALQRQQAAREANESTEE